MITISHDEIKPPGDKPGGLIISFAVNLYHLAENDIDYSDFSKQRKAFKKAIGFLNSEIMALMTYPVELKEAEIAVDALYDKLVNIGKGFIQAVDLGQQVASSIKISPEKMEQINRFINMCGQAAIDVAGIDIDENDE